MDPNSGQTIAGTDAMTNATAHVYAIESENGYSGTLTQMLANMAYVGWRIDNLIGLADEFIAGEAAWSAQ